jgi:3-deoxy-7-phosphoheptulonate synthase
MLESHLVAGKQAAEGSREYGVSVTDGCIDFATTEALLLEMAAAGSGARPGAGRSV